MSVLYICDYCGASQNERLTYPNNIFWLGDERLEGNGACSECWDKLQEIGDGAEKARKDYLVEHIGKMFDLSGVKPQPNNPETRLMS